MSGPLYALLLLPDPPQLLTPDNIHAAFHAPLLASLSLLKRSNEISPCILEIALPLSRLARVFTQHRSLFANVRTLLKDLYSLLATVYRHLSLPLNGNDPIDSRILLVFDDEEAISEGQLLPCGIVQFTALASSSRPWTHILVPDGENGEERYQRFRLTAVNTRPPQWQTTRVPGGLQFRYPNEVFTTESDTNTLVDGPVNKDTLIAVNCDTFDFTDKYVLTMGLFSAGTIPLIRVGQIPQSTSADQRKIYVATIDGSNEETQMQQQRRVVDFLLASLDFGEPKPISSFSSSSKTSSPSQTPFLLSTIEQRFRIQCLVFSQGHGINEEHAGLATIVVAGRNAEIAEQINDTRKQRGWKELDILQLESIEVVETTPPPSIGVSS